MRPRLKWLASGVFAALAVVSMDTEARAQAAITNAGGDLYLGVNQEGQLNIPESTAGVPVVNSSRLGLAIEIPSLGGVHDATSPGCFCEGWGVSASGTSLSANESVGGVSNITVDSFTSTATSITSSVSATSQPGLKVTQEYTRSAATDRIFENKVTITNDTGGTLTDVRYVRVMDWDIAPSEFTEMVTIRGTATTTFLEFSNDDGFASADPLAPNPTKIAACAVDTGDFTDCNTADHGAYFKFNFGELAAGESREFSVFYGAALTEREMLAGLSAVGAELFSLGQHDGDPTGGTPATYAFGFKGVGGTPVIPVPVPASILFMLVGLAGTGLMMMRRPGARAA